MGANVIQHPKTLSLGETVSKQYKYKNTNVQKTHANKLIISPIELNGTLQINTLSSKHNETGTLKSEAHVWDHVFCVFIFALFLCSVFLPWPPYIRVAVCPLATLQTSEAAVMIWNVCRNELQGHQMNILLHSFLNTVKHYIITHTAYECVTKL